MIITKKWLKAAGTRAVKTFAQAAVSMFTVGQAFMEVDWIGIASISATAAIFSLLTSVAGIPEAQKE